MATPVSTSPKINGIQKAAILLMSVDEEVATKMFAMLTEEEVKEISQQMVSLGNVDYSIIEDVITEFYESMGEGRGIMGNMTNAEKLLAKAFGAEKVATILEDISGPAGRNTWEKLNNVSELVLASYLKNEYPQTAALVLSKIRPAQAAKVLVVLPDDFSLEVMQRMLTLEPVKREVLNEIEKTLQVEFVSNLSAAKQVDSFEVMAEVFNNFDRAHEAKFMEMLENQDAESAQRIRDLMFTFDDLAKLDNAGIQVILRQADKDKLAVALKGANDAIRELFFKNMSERAAKIMREDMESRGPVRMKEVDEAQMNVVTLAKSLADAGEIKIPDGSEEEELVY